MNLELYRVFYTVVRCGSLTKAADELYISQPAVSQAIRQLEAQLGTQLFTRVHKGMQLTKQGGELIYNDVKKALGILENVESRLSEINHSATGTIRIGASETIFQYGLSDKLVEYHKRYPNVKLELLCDISPITIEQLKTDRCDVGFLNFPIAEDSEIVVNQTIMLLNDVFVAGKGYEFLKGKPLSIWDLQEFPLLLLQCGTVSRSSIDHFCQSLGFRFQPAIEVDSWGFMKQLVVEGMGIGCIPREYSKNKLRDGYLFELDVTPSLPSRSVGMALPRNGTPSYALRLFLELFHQKL